jgi:hypothetical protein
VVNRDEKEEELPQFSDRGSCGRQEKEGKEHVQPGFVDLVFADLLPFQSC